MRLKLELTRDDGTTIYQEIRSVTDAPMKLNLPGLALVGQTGFWGFTIIPHLSHIAHGGPAGAADAPHVVGPAPE